MLNQQELHALHVLASAYSGCDVLSVYLPMPTRDDASQGGARGSCAAWGRVMPHRRSLLPWAVAEQLGALQAREGYRSEEGRRALDAAIGQLSCWWRRQLPDPSMAGVVAFVTLDGVVYAAATAVAVAPVAVWERGLHLAPLLREASLGPPAAALLLEARRVHLYRFDPPGVLQPLETLVALGEPNAVGAVGHVQAESRGTIVAEEAGRYQLAARHHLYDEALRRADEAAGPEGWIAIAGSSGSVAAASALVPRTQAWRTIELERFDVRSSDAEVARALGGAIARREAQRDGDVVRELLEEHGARARGVAGIEATRAAIARAAVATLLMSADYVRAHALEADTLLATALAQGAAVREVAGMAGWALDLRAGGVAARLRYRVSLH